MISVFDPLIKTAKRDVKRRARKLIWITVLVVTSSIVALAGLGFLTASGFLALEVEIGTRMATLVIGLGFLLFAGILLICAFRIFAKPAHQQIPESQPAASDVAATDSGAIIAFTAAFVLARYVTGRKQR